MINVTGAAGFVFAAIFLGGCAGVDFSETDIDYFQPEIVSSAAPSFPLDSFSLSSNTVLAGLSSMRPIVPSFNQKGLLLASWNPHPQGIRDRPTLVIVHGGHGLGPTDFATALWAAKELKANTLVLDSFWSRGVQENWKTHTRFGANMRALDAIAAGRWLKLQGVDPDQVYLMGGSQGGWTVLRSFTKDEFIERNMRGLYAGGISLYPNCNSKGFRDDPTLGPYWAPVIVFTGGKDTATPPSACPTRVFKEARQWTHYPDATHAWDTANRGAHSGAVDGECGRAKNIYNRFPTCRSNAATFDMQQKIKHFVLN